MQRGGTCPQLPMCPYHPSAVVIHSKPQDNWAQVLTQPSTFGTCFGSSVMGTSVCCPLQCLTTGAPGTLASTFRISLFVQQIIRSHPKRSPWNTHAGRTPFLPLLYPRCWGARSPSAYSDPHLLLRPSEVCCVSKSWRKSPAIIFSLGGTNKHQSFSPKLPGRLWLGGDGGKEDIWKHPFPFQRSVLEIGLPASSCGVVARQ